MLREVQFSKDEWAEKVLLAKGNDSHVYRIKDTVVKIYGQLKPELLDHYLLALPRANELIRRHEYPRRLTLASTAFEIRFDAIDLESRGTIDGVSFTVSRYSPYPNLDVLTWPRHLFEEYLKRSFSYSTKSEVGFLSELNLAFLNERPTRLHDEFIYVVDLLSRSIDSHLGQSGHYIGKYNAKVIPNISEQRLTLQITDTAVYIDRVIF